MSRFPWIALAAIFFVACSSQGPAGPAGPAGPTGDAGPPGLSSCPATGPGGTIGLKAKVTVSSPANGSFFAAGERPVLTIGFTNSCGQLQAPADLSLAELFVYGPRAPVLTVTAYALENFAPAPFGAQSLIKPKYASDAGAPNLALGADNTVTYTLNPITTEKPGTYTAAVYTGGTNPLDQDFAIADFQIGTATVETFAAGSPEASSCTTCHTNVQQGGKTYFAHSPPAPPRAPVGNYALDQLPIGSCKACHNNASYSPNPMLRKTHGVHRGSHQLASPAGAAHPEYGFGQDNEAPLFTNVNFPVMPLATEPNALPDGGPGIGPGYGLALTPDLAMEKNCTACHVNDVWKTNISRAACGTCHDNLFFAGALLSDGGVDATATQAVFNPPSVLGKPTAGACATDNDCAVFSSIATCNKTAGDRYVGYCQLTYHQKMTDDSQCVTCHGEGSAIADVTKVHAIAQWQSPITLDGYKFTGVTVTGGSAAGNAFQVGDQPVLTFKLLDASGNAVTTLISDASWAGRFAISGPTSNPQRVIGTSSSAYNMKTQGTLTVDGTGTYTYTPPQTWPAQSLGAIGSFPAGGIQTNPTGSYTAFFYWNRSATPTTAYPAGPATVGDAVDAKTVVSFVVGGATAQPPQARQVVTQAACGSCHGQAADGFPHFAWHGSNARKDVEACSICHTENATSAPGVTTPPGPPEYSVDYQKMVHQIHLARLLDTPPAGALAEFAEVLSPVDVRSCNNCHGDSLVACKVATDCGYGQSCGANGKCQNTAFLNPTARACISCHNGADAQSHAAAMTSNGVETCNVCHGQGTQFAVDVMHNITTDFLVNLPYSREAP